MNVNMPFRYGGPHWLQGSACASRAAPTRLVPLLGLRARERQAHDALAVRGAVGVGPDAASEVLGPRAILWRLDLVAPADRAACACISRSLHLEGWDARDAWRALGT